MIAKFAIALAASERGQAQQDFVLTLDHMRRARSITSLCASLTQCPLGFAGRKDVFGRLSETRKNGYAR
jgi:hypothetical protein